MAMRKFRLQRVLDVRKIIEREKEKELSVAAMKLKREQDALAGIIEKKDGFVNQMNDARANRAGRLADYHGYLDTLLSAIFEQRKVIHATTMQVEIKRRNLLQATQDRKVLDKLKEKKHQEWLVEENRKEQEFLDELARR